MLFGALLFASLTLSASADCGFPNGTDTGLNWWQGPGTAPVTFSNAIPQNANGQLEYPIDLKQPLYVLVTLDNEDVELAAGNLLLSIKISQYGGFTGCNWSEVPTFGLLNNLDACTQGVPCPVAVGQQTITVVLDFSKFSSIVALLKNDAPYQIDLTLKNKSTGKYSVLVAQVRALTK